MDASELATTASAGAAVGLLVRRKDPITTLSASTALMIGTLSAVYLTESVLLFCVRANIPLDGKAIAFLIGFGGRELMVILLRKAAKRLNINDTTQA
jgi:hypothetical protein